VSASDERQSNADVRGVRRGSFTVTRLHRRGAWPLRVLVIGSQLALGSDRRQQKAIALSDQLADRIWLRSRRGVDLDVLWELRPVLRAVRGGLSAWRLWRYDAVVVIAPAHPLGLPSRLRMLGVLGLLRSVIKELAAASHVLVVSLETPRAWRSGAHRSTMPTFAAGLRVRGRTSALVDALAIPDDPSAGADIIADRLVEVLGDVAASTPSRRREQPDGDDLERRRAVDHVALPTDLTAHLQRVADMARNSFETEYAEIDLIGHERQHTLAAAGTPPEDLPISVSLCARAIETDGATIVEDALEAFGPHSTPRIQGSHVRFYAAYPIESSDGFRIGALCVFDTKTLRAEEVDIEALRDLALLAEAEIVSSGHEL